MSENSTSDKVSRLIQSNTPIEVRGSELGVIAVDATGRIAGMNPAASNLLSLAGETFVQRSLSELVEQTFAESDAHRTMHAIHQAARAGTVSTFEVHLSGDEIWATFVKLHVSPLYGQEATGPRVVLTLEDITPYRRAGLTGLAHENADRYTEALELAAQLEEQKEHYRLLSIHDGLTGLYNFAHFHVLLADEIARARRYGHSLALLMIDIDNFKSYNDAFGHPAGNWALRGVATILQLTSRQTDRVARYGGEEFAIILPETNEREAMLAARRLRQAVERGSRTGAGFRRTITVSIGVAGYPKDADNSHELILRADEMLYRAKAAGKNEVFGMQSMPAST